MTVINVFISKRCKMNTSFYVFTKNMLNSKFDMKNMRLADVIYVDKIIENFNNNDSGIARTPLNNSLYLSKNREDAISQVGYARIIKSLMYLMSCTIPNITYVVSKLRIYG